MKKNSLLLVLFAFAFVFRINANANVSPATNAVEETGMSHSQYVTGGVLGSIFGLGIGHAVQGRYSERGWIFTTSDVTGILLLANANCFRGRDSNSQDRAVRERGDCENTGQALLGASLIISSRVLQILDLWVLGNDRLIGQTSPHSHLIILPDDRQGKLVYSLSF